jgi:hypothetical protein
MRRSNRKNRRYRWRVAMPLCALAALVLTGAAGAANSGAYKDAARDVGLAADLTHVDVTTDDAGTITIRLTFGGGGLTPGLPGEQLGVALDLDQNPDTGTVYYGTEVSFMLDFSLNGETLKFARAAGSRFAPAAPPASLTGTIDDATGVVTFSVKGADLGLAPTGGFNLFAISASSVTDDADLAPDLRTFNYQLVAGTAPPPLRPDTRAPLDHAFASRGVHGKVARLDYSARDGRAVTADTVHVYRRAQLLQTIRIRVGDANPFFTY